MTKFFAALVSVSVLGLASAAFAGEPVQLTAQQMDTITAGAVTAGQVNLSAFATGRNAATETSGFARSFELPMWRSHLTYGVVIASGSSVSAN